MDIYKAIRHVQVKKLNDTRPFDDCPGVYSLLTYLSVQSYTQNEAIVPIPFGGILTSTIESPHKDLTAAGVEFLTLFVDEFKLQDESMKNVYWEFS